MAANGTVVLTQNLNEVYKGEQMSKNKSHRDS